MPAAAAKGAVGSSLTADSSFLKQSAFLVY
jgi:hypothetical protein